MNSVGSQHLDLQYFKLLLNTRNDMPQLLKCLVWDTQRNFSDYWAIVTELLQLLSVLTFHCNEVIFKLPARRALKDLLKPKGGWAPKTIPNFVTPGMNFASSPFLLQLNHPETLDNTTCPSVWLKLATSHHNTWATFYWSSLLEMWHSQIKFQHDRGSRKELVMPRQSSFISYLWSHH